MTTMNEQEANRTALRGPRAQTASAKWNQRYRQRQKLGGISVEEFLDRKRLEQATGRAPQKARSYAEVERSLTRPGQEYGGVF